jgi:chitinase
MIPDQSVKLGFGLIGFKLYLQDGIKTATVKIHFSTRVPKDAQLYKYIPDTGWEAYGNAAFAPNRKSVTLILEDGGMGDEDGVENGVIVDPTGIAYEDPMTSDSASLSTGGIATGGSSSRYCFISSAGIQQMGWLDSIYANAAIWMIMVILAAGIAFASAFQTNTNK